MTQAGPIEWQPYVWDTLRPASPEEIAQAESALGVSFPPSFRAALAQYQGAQPLRDLIGIPASPVRNTAFNVLYHVVPGEEEYGLVNVNRSSPNIPEGCIAFAEDPGGNHIAFDYRRPAAEPPIVFIDHERVGEADWVSPIAPTFDTFLAGLGP